LEYFIWLLGGFEEFQMIDEHTCPQISRHTIEHYPLC